MTDKITPKQQDAWNIYQEVLSLRGEQTKVALRQGYLLNKIKTEHLYRYMGEGGFDTFNQFLAEVKIVKGTALAYIRVYSYYVLTLKVAEVELYEIPFRRLNQLKGKIETLPAEQQIEWVEKAKVLLSRDFDAEMVDNKFKEPKAIEAFKCKKCHLLKILFRPDKVCKCEGSGYDIKAVKEDEKTVKIA